MLKMVDGTGIIGVDMVCPLGVSAPQPPNYDRVELEGAGMLVLPNSLDAPLERLELGGKTEQVQTTGAQLLPFPYVTGDMTKNGVTFAVQEDGGIKVTGTATEFVIFNIAKIDFGANSIFNNSTGNGKVLSGGKDNVKIEYHGLNKNTYLSIGKGLTVNTVIYPQLQNGTAATPYEPYTGGKPSPSPEYPQEIKNSGKWNEETQRYEVDVKVTNAEQNWSKEQTITITSDRPITKWDRLVEQGGQIGWLYNSVNETIDGKTGKWSIQPASKIFYRTDITFPIVVPFCIELLGYDYSMGGYKKDTGITINNLGILCITLPEEVELTLDAYKQYLADNPLHVLYKGDSEEFVPLPQSEQNAIRALKTYYPTTVITVDGGEVDPDIKVTYRKEI